MKNWKDGFAKEGGMSKELKELAIKVEQIRQKVVAQHRLGQSTLLLLKNYDARIVTLTHLCAEAGIFTLEKFEEEADKKLGLRLRAIGEEVQAGDTIWVKYTAINEGDPEVAVDEIPVRLGSGAIIFEPALIGKVVGQEGIKYEAALAQGPNAGKKVSFDITIVKAKTRIEGYRDEFDLEGEQEDGTDGADTGAGSGDSSTNEGEGKLSTQAGGSGHEEPSPSPDQSI